MSQQKSNPKPKQTTGAAWLPGEGERDFEITFDRPVNEGFPLTEFARRFTSYTDIPIECQLGNGILMEGGWIHAVIIRIRLLPDGVPIHKEWLCLNKDEMKDEIEYLFWGYCDGSNFCPDYTQRKPKEERLSSEEIIKMLTEAAGGVPPAAILKT